MQILYVEDSQTLRETVAIGLRQSGYAVETAEDGATGLDIALTGTFDVVLLDVMLPGEIDGFEMLRQLRESPEFDSAILMLTARVAVQDRVFGLDAGADDYLIKPFAFDELLARIRLLIRRKFGKTQSTFNTGPIRIDLEARRSFVGDRELRLRPREFDILEFLALREGGIVSRIEITEHVYDHAVDLKSNAIDSAICNLRKALAEVGCPDCIRTVPRRGYLLEFEID